MSIRFATRVICYCLGKGRLSLRGAQSRPWLEIKRPESDHCYLRHQARTLRQLHHGDLDLRWDRRPGRSFYDVIVLRVQSDQLWPAYELLYARDRRRISADALDQAGLTGLAALWCDTGVRSPGKAEVQIQDCAADDDALAAWGAALGFPLTIRRSDTDLVTLRWHGEVARLLMKELRPIIHPVRRPTTWPPKETNEELYA